MMFAKLLLLLYSLFFPNCEFGVYVGPRFPSGAIPGDYEDRAGLYASNFYDGESEEDFVRSRAAEAKHWMIVAAGGDGLMTMKLFRLPLVTSCYCWNRR
jgi:hypothetical protein